MQTVICFHCLRIWRSTYLLEIVIFNKFVRKEGSNFQILFWFLHILNSFFLLIRNFENNSWINGWQETFVILYLQTCNWTFETRLLELDLWNWTFSKYEWVTARFYFNSVSEEGSNIQIPFWFFFFKFLKITTKSKR